MIQHTKISYVLQTLWLKFGVDPVVRCSPTSGHIVLILGVPESIMCTKTIEIFTIPSYLKSQLKVYSSGGLAVLELL